MLAQRWFTPPTVKQRWANVSFLLGIYQYRLIQWRVNHFQHKYIHTVKMIPYLIQEWNNAILYVHNIYVHIQNYHISALNAVAIDLCNCDFM